MMQTETLSVPGSRIAPLPVAPRPGVRRQRTRTAPRSCVRQRVASHVINEDLFRGVLLRERRRSDRSNQAFLLLLLSAEGSAGVGTDVAWGFVAAALAAARRDTDILGWLEERAVLGLILPDVADPAVVGPEIESRVRQELAKRLNPEKARRFTIRLHAHLPAPAAEAPLQSVDALLPAIEPDDFELYAFVKRAFDLVTSLALLTLLSPLMLLVAALVKCTSPGPIFFRQVRIGRMAKPFTMLKFRTMYVNNDNAVHQQYVSWFIKSSSQAQQSGKADVFKIKNDPRVTAIGRFLRKTSFDELPQLWNVVRGDMSLVGPRPPLQYEVDQYQRWHCRRVLEAKPGITGLWQVSGRSRTTFDEMVRLDLRYARTCSLWTDIKILLATPAAVISGKGAC
jgi:lipopolysaccharide/colanic/teichoic acid biosynthesis glycosyltransferase